VSKAPLVVEQLTHAETSSLHYGALPEDIANFPGMVNLVAGSGAVLTPGAGTLTLSISGGGVGTVTSVNASGGTTGLTFSGGPITTAGTITMAGTLAVANGGTGATNATAARANLGAGTGNGSVTSVAVSGSNGIGVTGSPITTSGTFALSLGAITPTSVSTSNLTVSSTVSVPAQSIALASIPNSVGLSVLGRSAASSGVRSDITSTGARTFLASSSANTAVAFRAIDAADLPGGDWITATAGMDYAASFTNISADSTWYDTGVSVSLVAGTYLITSFCHGILNKSTATNAGVISRMYDVTAGAAVTDSECMIVSDSTAAWNGERTGTLTMILTIGTTSTIRVEASRITGGSYTQARISNNTNGRSGITYVRIA